MNDDDASIDSTDEPSDETSRLPDDETFNPEAEGLVEALEDLSEFDAILDDNNLTGIHVITISYNDTGPTVPTIDLGDCSPWTAIALLKAAMDSLEIMIPPVNVRYKNEDIVSHDVLEFDDEEEDG